MIDDFKSSSSKKINAIERKTTKNRSFEQGQKSKTIKKNCESAKMSRKKKKVYLEHLEDRAKSLMADIAGRKVSIRKMSDKILHKFSQSNRDVA